MRTSTRRSPFLRTILAVLFVQSVLSDRGGAEPPPPLEVSPSGQSLLVPDAHKSLGTPYYALPGRDAQVTFTSKAPLEEIKGSSAGVIGYAISPASGEPAALAAGEFHLPVATLSTGIPLRDQHLQSAAWLDTAAFRSIVFRITGTQDVAPAKQEKDFKTYNAKLVGDLIIHGVTQPVTLDATITVMPAGNQTKSIAQGDLMAIRTKFDVKLEDYGIKNRVIGQKVSPIITLDTVLYLSTVPAEQQVDPKAPPKPEPKPATQPSPKPKRDG